MKEELKILALIPARKGSKRLPGKNIKKFCGKPLIAWTIDASLSSKYVNKTVVSTDCQDIAKVSMEFGADVPFIRPSHLATDTATTVDVIFHALKSLQDKGENFSHLLLLQPTSPLRTFDDINSSIDALIKSEANAIYSVCEVEHSPLWSNTLPKDKSFDGFLNDEIIGVRSQDLPKYYRLNGAIYLVKISELKKNKKLHNIKPGFAYIMDNKTSIDIDDEIGFKLASLLMESML